MLAGITAHNQITTSPSIRHKTQIIKLFLTKAQTSVNKSKGRCWSPKYVASSVMIAEKSVKVFAKKNLSLKISKKRLYPMFVK